MALRTLRPALVRFGIMMPTDATVKRNYVKQVVVTSKSIRRVANMSQMSDMPRLDPMILMFRWFRQTTTPLTYIRSDEKLANLLKSH